MIQHLHTLQRDYHSKAGNHLSPHKVIKTLLTFPYTIRYFPVTCFITGILCFLFPFTFFIYPPDPSPSANHHFSVLCLFVSIVFFPLQAYQLRSEMYCYQWSLSLPCLPPPLLPPRPARNSVPRTLHF